MSNGESATAPATTGEENREKRKRAVEPDGGPDVGLRGQGVPVVQSAKKAKTEIDESKAT